MTKIQEQKLKMYIAIITLLEANVGILSKIPNGNVYLTELKNLVDLILADIKLQGSVSTATKKALRKKLEESALSVSEHLVVFADDRKDSALMDAVKFNKTELRQVTETQLLNDASVLYDKTQAFLSELAVYGITAAILADFANDIALFRQSIPETEISKQESKDVTEKVNTDFDRADEVVDSLDLRMELVKKESPVFYTDYQNLRKINVRERKSALAGDVTDAQTGAPVPKARLVFGLAGKSDIEKYSTELGNFRIKTLESGIYTVTVSKIGYQTQTLSATVTGDETCVLQVKMEK
jgi:hypothetical protein